MGREGGMDGGSVEIDRGIGGRGGTGLPMWEYCVLLEGDLSRMFEFSVFSGLGLVEIDCDVAE